MGKIQGFVPEQKDTSITKKSTGLSGDIQENRLCIDCVYCINVDKLGKNMQCENDKFIAKKDIVSVYVPELFDCLDHEARPK